MGCEFSPIKFIRKYPLETITILGFIIFILYKISDIGAPYFWDEAGVYVPGALNMKDSGHIGLLPRDLDPDLSRGHPLLFYFCNALVFKYFGDTVIAGHIFALVLAISTLIVFYFFARKEFGPIVATISIGLLSIQPIFFSLSTILLPEMMLTLFTLISLRGIIRNEWILYASGASLAILTKESAIVLPVLGVTVLFISGIKDRDLFTLKRLKLLMIGLIPVLIFGLFFIIQKIQRGWFFFPEHIGYIHYDLPNLRKIGGRILYEMFLDQGRWLIGLTFLAGLALCILAKPLKIEFKCRPLLVFAGFLMLVLIFADINYYLTRYILYTIPVIVLGGVYTAVNILRRISPQKKAISSILIILFTSGSIINAQQNMVKFPYTCDMSYKWVLDVTESSIHWVEQQPWKNDTINANFPISNGLSDKRNGFLLGDPIPYIPNLEKVRNYALFFYEWGPDNIPVPKEIKYRILKTWSKSYANVVAIQFIKPAKSRVIER
jgi:4-amino-4-deoxy-L-arabinose transferase-like glycosyltransferase